MEHPESSPVEQLSPAAPGRREPLELAARVLSILMLGWLVALAVLAWLAYDEGYTGLLLPVWNGVFALAVVPIVHGIFSRRLWAQRWVVGISAFTAIGSAFQASRADSTLLWGGALLLGIVAIVVSRARPLFNDSDGNRGRIQRAIATIVTIGSIGVSLFVMQGGGTERGRMNFAREIQAAYDKLAPDSVRVQVKELILVIEAVQDNDAQIDEAANAMQAQLATAGKNAKAWVVGFERIIVTNGRHERSIRAGDARGP